MSQIQIIFFQVISTENLKNIFMFRESFAGSTLAMPKSGEVDLLVIKKDSGVQITNEIGKLFCGHNIVEYKSPLDHLNIDTFYKAGAYASLYKGIYQSIQRNLLCNR